MKSVNQRDLEQVHEYVLRSVVRAQNGRKCVDGRYLPDQASGMIARPGGDSGYVMALMAVSAEKGLNLSAQECFDIVYKAVVHLGDRFAMHTDHHVDPDEHTHTGLIGCGHLAKASMKSLCGDYNVQGEDIEKVVNYARNLAKKEPSVELINLAGDHAEKGVLVIESKDYTINASSEELGQMYFIYDELRDTDFMGKLVDMFELPSVTFEAMKRASDQQLQATLQNLAKGLPIYKIAFVGKQPNVSYVGIV